MTLLRPALLYVVLAVGLLPANALADRLYLAGGSQVYGQLVGLDQGELVFRTEFAGELKVEAGSVRGLTTEQAMVVALDGDQRLVGRLVYRPGRDRQIVAGTVGGDVELAVGRIEALWPPDQPSPELRRLRALQRTAASVWSGSLAIGVTGSEGNTQRLSLNGQAEARRETDFDRLLLRLAGNFAQEEGEQTENEVIGLGRLERDFSDRWFVFGSLELERDRFENLDLRALLDAGLGYFFIREENQEWKGRAGAGYQLEAFEERTEEAGVLSLGYDYRVDVAERLRFIHNLTYTPDFTAPASDYRLDSNAAIRVPIGGSEAWNLKLGVRNQYDSSPQPGIEKLDTTYFLNLGYDFE